MVDKAVRNLKKLTDDFEVIVVDDGSSDNSRELLLKKTQRYDCLKLVFHRKNKGYGGALISGFKAASKELIFYTDGDGQYDVDELPLLVSLMTEDVNFINGIKMERQDFAYRVIVGNLYALAMRWAFLLPIIDVDCDFRLIRKTLIDKIKLRHKSGAICVELVKKAHRAKAKFRQVSIHHYDRVYGQSQFFRLNIIIKTLGDLGQLWWELMVKRKQWR